MNDTAAPTKRPYMRRQRRRRVLLACAADLVETRGWNALTMISLARHAGVSRQTVYEHFASIDELVTETVSAIFRDVFFQIIEVVAEDSGDPLATVRELEQLTYAIPRGRARALWQIIAASGAGDSPLAATSRKLRHLLVKQYHPLIGRALDIPQSSSRPLTWMIIMAFWGAWQLVDGEELELADASRLFAWMVGRLLVAHPSGQAPPVKPPTVSAAR